MMPISVFSNGIELSGAAITLIGVMAGSLIGAIGVLWRSNAQAARRLIQAKDAHIDAITSVVASATLAMKDLNGAVSKLDEHLEASSRNTDTGASQNRIEHAALLDCVRHGQEQADNRYERLIEKLNSMNFGERR